MCTHNHTNKRTYKLAFRSQPQAHPLSLPKHWVTTSNNGVQGPLIKVLNWGGVRPHPKSKGKSKTLKYWMNLQFLTSFK